MQVVFSYNPVCHLDFSFEVVIKDALWKKQRRPCGARPQQTRRRRREQVSFQPEAAIEHYYTEWTQHQYAVFKSDKNITSFSCLTIRFPRTQSDTANTAEDEGIWFQALTQPSWIKQSSMEQSVQELVEVSQWRAHAIQKRREQGGTATVFMSGNKWIKGFLCCATHVHAPTVDTLTRVACIYRWSCIIHMCSNPSYILIINLCVCDVFIFPWLVSCCPLWPRLFLNCSVVANPCNDLSILQRWSTGPCRKERKQLQQQWRVRWRPLTHLYSHLTDESDILHVRVQILQLPTNLSVQAAESVLCQICGSDEGLICGWAISEQRSHC